VLLSGIGGLLGVLVTVWSVGPLVALSPLYGAGEFDIEPRLDLPTLAFTIALIMAVGIAFAVLPAIGMARTRASDVLKAIGRSGTLSRGSRRSLKGLVVIELALAWQAERRPAPIDAAELRMPAPTEAAELAASLAPFWTSEQPARTSMDPAARAARAARIRAA